MNVSMSSSGRLILTPLRAAPPTMPSVALFVDDDDALVAVVVVALFEVVVGRRRDTPPPPYIATHFDSKSISTTQFSNNFNLAKNDVQSFQSNLRNEIRLKSIFKKLFLL